MNKRIKKYFAAFLIVVLFFAEMRLDSFAAAMQDDDNQNTNTMFQVYETDTVNVTFQVTDSWEGGYNAVVSIENLSDQVLHNWSLDLQYAHDISSIWNAVIIAKNENGYSIRNAGWNQDIDPGMVTTFGIGAQEGFAECPSAVVLQSDEIIVANDQYEVQYAVDNDWLSEFIASLVIKNVGESPIEDWVLTFEYENEITNIWNAVIEKHLDNRYVIRNAGYNANIEARGNTTIGFIVEGESVVEPPKNIELH